MPNSKETTQLFERSSKSLISSKSIKSTLYIIMCASLVMFVIYYIITNSFMHHSHKIMSNQMSIHSKNVKINETDFHKLFNITDFEFQLQQPPCSEIGINLDLLILVHSAPDHFKQRQTIRQTWGSQKQNSQFGNFRVLFLLGLVSNSNQKEQGMIVLENLQFKDIIQGNFIDHYRNLTYKHVMGLKWFHYFCDEVKVILKVDDDVFVNTPFILQSFETDFWQLSQDKNGNFLICNLMVGSEIVRDNQTKYYVSEEMLGGDVFPDYCSGYAIFYARQTALKLYEEAQKMSYLNIDDAFMTGVVREKTDIGITQFEFLENPDIELVLKNLRDYQDDTMKNFFIGPFELQPKTMLELWNALSLFIKKSDAIVKF